MKGDKAAADAIFEDYLAGTLLSISQRCVSAAEHTGRKVIRNLVRKGWLTRLGGGRYMLLPPERGVENVGEKTRLPSPPPSRNPM